MPRFVTTRAAEEALAEIIRQELEAATPNNDLVSHDERDALHPFVQRSADEVRSGKPKYARVKVDEVEAHAMTAAKAAWDSVNPPDNERDHRLLAQDEIVELAKSDPALAELTLRAYEIARGDRAVAVRRAIEAQPNIGALLRRTSTFGNRIDARAGQAGRDTVPASVQSAFDAHFAVEAADLGAATLKTFPLAGGAVYALYGTTDGDDQRLELFDENGLALASGRFHADGFARWDAHFGEGRFAGIVGRVGRRLVEGLSETDEQRAAGQITNDWAPDVVATRARFDHGLGVITRFDTPLNLPADQDEVFRAVVELAYERTLQIAAGGMNDVDLSNFGAVRIGTHHDMTDGEDYIVGDWRDVDDASFTFYFQRDDHGRLFVAREQYNG